MLVPRHPPPAVETAVGCVVVNVGSGDRARTSNDLPVRTRGVPNGKVVRPPLQVPIQLPNQCQDRLKALMTVRHLVQLLPLPLDSLFRRKHIQVLLIAPFQIAIIPKRVSRKFRLAPSTLKSTTRVFSRLIS